jgi:5-methylcytosine-specific restriction endonuclease McrA
MEIMVRDFGECVRCRVLYNRWTPDMPGKPLQMHHIKNQAEYPHLRREPTNLIMLCEDCHSVYDNGKINELDFHYNFPPFYE